MHAKNTWFKAYMVHLLFIVFLLGSCGNSINPVLIPEIEINAKAFKEVKVEKVKTSKNTKDNQSQPLILVALNENDLDIKTNSTELYVKKEQDSLQQANKSASVSKSENCTLSVDIADNTEDAADQFNLALIYLNNLQSTDKDRRKGLELLEESVNHEYAPAKFKLGIIYLNGEQGVQKDRRKGLKLLRESAAQAYPPAQDKLGLIYLNGEEGIQKNSGKGLKLLKKAAKQGYAPAEYDLAVVYLKCEGSVELEKGLKLLEKAANQEYALAKYALGFIYLNKPQSTGEDRCKGLELLKKSLVKD